MGISMFISAREFRLSNAIDFNDFLNEVSKFGDYPNLLQRSYSEGQLRLDYTRPLPTLFNSSVQELLNELEDIREKHWDLLSESSQYILQQMRRACKFSITTGKRIDLQ